MVLSVRVSGPVGRRHILLRWWCSVIVHFPEDYAEAQGKIQHLPLLSPQILKAHPCFGGAVLLSDNSESEAHVNTEAAGRLRIELPRALVVSLSIRTELRE